MLEKNLGKSMKDLVGLTLLFVIILGTQTSVQGELAQGDIYQPEEGSAEVEKSSGNKKEQAKKKLLKIDKNLPMVLILGDSISIGYTELVRSSLEGKANVIHNPGNSQGTTHTLANIDEWLAVQEWDVIHFNLGLHDLKRVKVAGGKQNSNNPNDPRQADLKTYTTNLEKIVKKLKATEAELIFATTTPFPSGVKPFRDPLDVERYNTNAREIMDKHAVAVNDLCALMAPQLERLQKPKNVHFKPKGSQAMAEEVVRSIERALDKR